MKKMISLLLTTVLATSAITIPTFAAVHKTDEYGQTIYVEGDKLNNKVYPLSEAPEMDHTFTFNDVVFSNYIKNESTYMQTAEGNRVFVCRVTIGLDGVMQSNRGDVEFMAYHGGFHNRPAYMKDYGADSDLVAYKTNTPYYTKVSSVRDKHYFNLEDLYVKPYADGGRADDGSWNKGLTWQFTKNPDKVRSNGSYLDIFQIRVDHGTKISYFEVRVTDDTKFYGKTDTPPAPVVTYPETASANPTDSRILVNGKDVAFDAYNINGNNYFKLRDVAFALQGTEKQFEVSWNPSYKEAFSAPSGAIEMKSSTPYTATGGEMKLGNGSVKKAKLTRSPILKDGIKVSKLTGYNINDNNYFKLRDLGELFNFNVSWDGTLNTIVIDTSKPYTS